jgi:hypothetical protein
MANQNYNRLVSKYSIRDGKMNLFDAIKNPENIAHCFSQYIKAAVKILIWSVIAIASLAAAYIAIKGVWFILQMALNGLGI